MSYLDPSNPSNPPMRADAELVPVAPWGSPPGRGYIIPDDWYANHGLAPGDARKPQQAIEGKQTAAAAWGDATSGKLVPTPPMRGYFGKPPYKLPLPLPRGLVTRSPFAVSDMMPGVHGLGSDANIDAILSRMNKDMKNLMIEQAAVSTGIAVALLTIPVAGWVASAVYSVIQGIVGSQNQREAQKVMADTEQKANAIVADYKARLSVSQDAVFSAEAPAASQLAATCAPLNGLGGWTTDLEGLGSPFGIKNIMRKATLFVINPIAPLIKPATKIIKKVAPHSVDKVVDKAASPVVRLEKEVDHSIDVLSGQAAVEKAKKARTQILAKVEADMNAQYVGAVANMNTTAFRDNLRTQMAIRIRQDPSIQGALISQCGLMPTTGSYVDPVTGLTSERVDANLPTGSKAAPWAGLAAAGAVLLALGIGHK